MTVAQAVRDAASALEATSDTPRLDAELLMAFALGVVRSELLLRRMNDEAPHRFAALVDRRVAHEPVAYITGSQEFFGLEFEVSPAVLIPRGDSETVIEAAKAAFAGRSPRRILDLGTGSGALLIAALTVWPDAQGLGVDRSPDALAVAGRNARAHVAKAPDVRLMCSDWTEPGWASGLGRFDLILANPPYVEVGADLAPDVRAYEPAEALFAGADGLAAYRVLLPQLPALLADGGVACVEIGATQAGRVTELAKAAGLAAKPCLDLAARPRVLQLTVGR